MSSDPADATSPRRSMSLPTRAAGISEGPEGEIVVVGPVDLSTSRALRAAIEKRTGTGALVVDLCDVQLLQSPGVAVLFDAAEHGLHLKVRAASAVASVIRICGLDRVAQVEHLP